MASASTPPRILVPLDGSPLAEQVLPYAQALLSGLRQVLFGVAAAAITFGIGRLFGATLGG